MSAQDRPFPEIPGQRGLATVPQLLKHGWTSSALRQARSMRFQEPMPRVLAPHRGPLDAATFLVAAGLWAGPPAVLSGAVALTQLGITVPKLRVATFVIPETARARVHERARLVRTTREVPVVLRRGVVAVTGAGRAIADAAVYESHRPEELEHWTISALQRGLTTPELLERELWQRPGAKVEPVWRGLAGFGDGAWSRPEVALRKEVEGAAGFPPLLTNCALLTTDGQLVGMPDGYIEEAGTAIQVHSRTYHQGFDAEGGDRWARTVEKDSDFVAAGVRVIGVTPWTLYAKPQRFLNRLRKAVDVGLELPWPAVRVVPREQWMRRS